jgi:uroporphyrin-3 C-methyltransferase
MSELPTEPAPPPEARRETLVHRRAGGRSGRFTTAIAVTALLASVYAITRLDSNRDRVDSVKDVARGVADTQNKLRLDLNALADRELAARRELEIAVGNVAELPARVQEFGTTLEELRKRTEGPERAWGRAEALFLLQIAERRLLLDRQIPTAIAALEAADTRLAALPEPALTPVREQIARDLLALRATREPDLAGIMARLKTAEESATSLPVKGIVPAVRTAGAGHELPPHGLARAWAILSNAASSLVTIRRVDQRSGEILTLEQQALRRQHLETLFFTARHAVIRHDRLAFQAALGASRVWLTEYFDDTSLAVRAALDEIKGLEPLDIAPPLPDISASSRLLARMTPAIRPAS